MNIFAAKLNFKMTESQLKALFAPYGHVESCKLILDRKNGNRSKGYGFIDMPNEIDAKRAIADLNGSEQMGRKIVVTEADRK